MFCYFTLFSIQIMRFDKSLLFFGLHILFYDFRSLYYDIFIIEDINFSKNLVFFSDFLNNGNFFLMIFELFLKSFLIIVTS
jgi:hypothetical protein